jgi:hypothetical protein
VLLGKTLESCRLTSTGLLPSTARLSRKLRLQQQFLTLRTYGNRILNAPTTPHTQRSPAITRTWFSLFRFRSPLLTESLLFSLPAGTEMFHFPAFPPDTLCVQVLVTGFRMPAGFPHSDTPGSQLGCQLPGAYRRLQRPSSALGAKTSTDCP